MQPILDAYLSGDLGAALERAEAAQSSPRALRLLGQLKTFDAAYKEGLARSQAKKTNEAQTDQFTVAVTLDEVPPGFDLRYAGFNEKNVRCDPRRARPHA